MKEQYSDPSASPRTGDDKLSDLLKASAGGDALCFESFYDATVSDALALASQLAGEQREDVLTASYLQAWHEAARFDAERGSALDWLLAIVRGQAHGRDRERPSE